MFQNNLFLLFKLVVSVFSFFSKLSDYFYISKGNIEIDASYLILRLVNISFRIECHEPKGYWVPKANVKVQLLSVYGESLSLRLHFKCTYLQFVLCYLAIVCILYGLNFVIKITVVCLWLKTLNPCQEVHFILLSLNLGNLFAMLKIK